MVVVVVMVAVEATVVIGRECQTPTLLLSHSPLPCAWNSLAHGVSAETVELSVGVGPHAAAEALHEAHDAPSVLHVLVDLQSMSAVGRLVGWLVCRCMPHWVDRQQCRCAPTCSRPCAARSSCWPWV